MGLIVLGPFVNDVLTMLVFRFSDILPGKHWFLVIAPAIEGIMGCESVYWTLFLMTQHWFI